jgi:hypothetical protein
MSDAELISRALAAYFRTIASEKGEYHDLPDRDSGVAEHEGRRYVVLRSVSGTLAVYRVRGSGALRRMKRWPREVADR